MANIISLSELANELGIAEAEIIGICEALGIPVKGAHSSVNIAYAEMIRRRAKLDGLSRGNSSKPQDRSSTPTTNTERIRPPAKRRSLNLLHLQQHMSINGRDALASRQFLTHMRSDNHNTMVKAIVDEATVSNPELLADYLTPSEFLAEQPDVITSEGSLLSFGIDQLRINSELLRDYLTAGGVVIADGIGIHNHSFGRNGAPHETYDEAWQTLQGLGRFDFLDGQSPDHQGVRLRNHGNGLSGHPQISGYEPRSATHASWLSPAYRNISKLHVLNVRPFFPGSDLLGAIDEPCQPVDLAYDQIAELFGPFPWGIVRQIGSGFLVLIAGIVMNDVVVDGNPDNAIFIQQLAELLVGEAEREKELRGGSKPKPTEIPRPLNRASETAPEHPGEFAHIAANGESYTVEFKSSMIHSYKPEVPEKVITSQVIKTIAAFLNSEGGTLVIGADDDAQPLGIEPDLTARNFDLDRYENFVMTSIVNNIGTVAASQCRVRFEAVNDKTICIVDVRPSTRPVFANTDKGNEVFYIRTGNATRALKGEEIINYAQDRFGDSNA